jgi:hypothetical protein
MSSRSLLAQFFVFIYVVCCAVVAEVFTQVKCDTFPFSLPSSVNCVFSQGISLTRTSVVCLTETTSSGLWIPKPFIISVQPTTALNLKKNIYFSNKHLCVSNIKRVIQYPDISAITKVFVISCSPNVQLSPSQDPAPNKRVHDFISHIS